MCQVEYCEGERAAFTGPVLVSAISRLLYFPGSSVMVESTCNAEAPGFYSWIRWEDLLRSG